MLSSISRVTLDTAAALSSIPNHPQALTVVWTDFRGRVRTAPIEICVNAQVLSCYFLLYHAELTDIPVAILYLRLSRLRR